MNKIRWGILSTANIAVNHIVPALNSINNTKITAVASRDLSKTRIIANQLGIDKAYDTYEELLTHVNVDVVYNPLQNQLPYTVEVLKNGPHVLCEKPISLNHLNVDRIINSAEIYPNLKIMEGFMYKFHLQGLAAKKMINDGEMGKVICMQNIIHLS